MAVPTVGKCIVVILLVLVLYTGNAFRIRDAVQSTGTVDKLRSNVRGASTLGKCTADVSTTDASSNLVPLSKRRYKSVRVSGKAKETSVETETSAEELMRYVGKFSSFAKLRTPEAKAKSQRTALVDKSTEEEEEDEEVAVVGGDDDDDDDDGGKETNESDEEDIEVIDADEDDDGVVISTNNSSEEGGEVAMDETDDDEDDTESNIKTGITADGNEENDDDDDDDENIPAMVPPTMRKLEKVRLADKDKARSIEMSQTSKPASVEKPMEPTESTKKIEKSKKVKDVDGKKLQVEVRVNGTASKVSVTSETPKPRKMKASTKSEVTKVEETLAPSKMTKEVKVKRTVEDTKVRIKKKKSASGGSSGEDPHQPKSTTTKRRDASISLTELNNAIQWAPTFVPNFTVVEDPVCQQHGKIFLRQLRGHKLWALQMLDAGAKISSGLLRGNINQLGDFDECLGITARVKVDEKTVKIQGKYCLATLDLRASIPDTKVPVNLMQSRGFIRASMRDPGHFIPRFTTANWALCIPAACSAEDARGAVESGLSRFNVSSGVRFNVEVDPEMCYVRQKGHTYSKETIAVVYFYAMITCVVLVATVRDYLTGPREKGNFSERIIMSFSLRRTVRILTREGRSDAGDIGCVNGIRSLATIALYVAHKIIPAARIPYANRIALTEVANSPISSVLRASLVYTDCFLLLSGLLTGFNMARERSSRGEIRWFCRFVARFVRLTPALLVTLFWYAYVMEHTGSGPQWNSVITTNAQLCKQNSWTNILYIQNFFPFEEMCATHTHQLALDMQLSLLAPVLIFFLTFKPIIGILLVFLLLQVSATLRYFATTNNYLSLVIFHGMSMRHLYKTANLTYALPMHRASPYIFGVGLGALLHYTGKNVRMYRIFVISGWLVAAGLGSWSLISPWRMARKDYTYDVEEAAQYAVIAPVSWSLALCWIIFACYTDHGGFLNEILSHYWMIFFSRISYAVYLCQFAIFFYNVGTTRHSGEFQIHRFIDPYEAAAVVFVSIILTLFIDIPMQELKNVIMECSDSPTVVAVGDVEEKSEGSKGAETNEHASIVDESARTEWDLADESERRMSVEEDGLVERRGYRYHREDLRRDGGSVSTGHSGGIVRHEASRASEPKSLDTKDSKRKLSKYEDQARARSCEPAGREHPRRTTTASRREPPGLLSSGSEDESVQYQQRQPHRHHEKPAKILRRQPAEPKVSDEEDWEQELRIRRRRFMERLASENRNNDRVDEGNDGWDGIERRSSAEGKLALLRDPTESNVMDSWTVSRGSRVLQPGSSQETEDDSGDAQYQRDYYENRRQTSKEDDRSEEESSRVVTSLEDEDDVENNDFVLKKESKRISVMDLSKLSREESESDDYSFDWNVVKEEEQRNAAPSKLFKRESIVKSQASEEDPEYVLPERPKLLEQEQDHPFKKAWQLQKSRSEEDPSAYALKECKPQADAARSHDTVGEDIKESRTKQSSGAERTSVNPRDDIDNTDTTVE